MRLGMFMQPVHDPKRDLNQVLEEDRQTVILADKLGYHEIWVGEHTAATSEPITDPMVFLATLLGETKQIKMGPGVYCLPHHHPSRIAGQAALFDHLSKGRFQMGIGSGSLSSDMELFAVDGDTDRGAMVRESIKHILAIWAGEPPYSREGEFWNVKIENVDRVDHGVGCFIKPYQQPHPPIAISIMSPNSGSARMAGEHGWIPISGAAFLHPRYTASHWTAYQEGCEKAGRTADPDIWRVSRNIIVAANRPGSARLHHGSGRPGQLLVPLSAVVAARTRIARVRGAGRPPRPGLDDLAGGSGISGRLGLARDGHRQAGCVCATRPGTFGVLTAMALEWSPAFGKQTMTLLANEVMPAFAQHADAARVASAAE